MKLMIASDLHGSAYFTRKLMEACQAERPSKLLLLGDLLYHGPRNALPRDYDCMAAEWDGLTLYATHGHLWNEDCLPPMAPGTVLLNGHFHVPACVQHDGYLYLNPGSVSIPKDGSVGSYLVLEDGVFTWKDMEGVAYKTHDTRQ